MFANKLSMFYFNFKAPQNHKILNLSNQNHQDRPFNAYSNILVNLPLSSDVGVQNLGYSFSGKRWDGERIGEESGEGGISAFRPNVSSHQFKA